RQRGRLVGAGRQVDRLAAEGAHLPAQEQRPVAARARPFQARLAPGTEDEVLLDALLTNRTRIVDLDALEERLLLERLLIELGEGLGGAHDGVDQEPGKAEDGYQQRGGELQEDVRGPTSDIAEGPPHARDRERNPERDDARDDDAQNAFELDDQFLDIHGVLGSASRDWGSGIGEWVSLRDDPTHRAPCAPDQPMPNPRSPIPVPW